MRGDDSPDEGGAHHPALDWVSGTLMGLVTAAVAIGVAELVAGIVDPQASPIVAVGQAAIDATPEWLKSFAIRAFGSSDKAVLLFGIAGVLLAIAIALGLASRRRLGSGILALAAFGAVGALAAVTRPGASVDGALPSVAGAVAGVGTLLVLHHALPAASAERSRRAAGDVVSGAVDRRRFFLTVAGGVAVAAAAGGAGRLFERRFRADESRAAVRIPTPTSPAATREGIDLGLPNLGPFFTPNGRFYRVDTALLVPSVMAEEWRLRVHGMVDREVTIDYPALLSRPMIERDVTLTCVSNEVGGDYVGTARWIGAPLRDLLEEAGVRPGADQIVTRSVDGFTVGTPTAVAMDGRDAMLAVAMNGEPLPLAHGFPVRMIVPGLYGYVSATKWVVDLQLTTFAAFDPYWIQRGWAEQAPIKTMSRIDSPRSFASAQVGLVAIAGVAWAQHVGIDRVEVRIDEGAWASTELAAEDTTDTWRQWVFRWDATRGEHRIAVRATDRTGYTQTEERAEPFPDGATGYHSVVVRID
jgi:DMSO/TMAO reductase YedYZ molybdopterin-dependent catalytic subunit